MSVKKIMITTMIKADNDYDKYDENNKIMMIIMIINNDNPKVCLLQHLEATNQTIKGRLAALAFPCIAEFFNQVSHYQHHYHHHRHH